MAFGRAVRTIRVRHRLSQEEVGLRSGIARSYYGRIERGEASATYETIVKLAIGLDAGPAEIIALAERFRLGEERFEG